MCGLNLTLAFKSSTNKNTLVTQSFFFLLVTEVDALHEPVTMTLIVLVKHLMELVPCFSVIITSPLFWEGFALNVGAWLCSFVLIQLQEH